jgi:HK97 family phage major capsid protein
MKNRQKIVAMREKRVTLVNNAREIVDHAEAAGREMFQDELEQYNKIMAEVQTLKDSIERQEKLAAEEDDLAIHNQVPAFMNPQAGQEQDAENPRASAAYGEAFNSYLMNGLQGMKPSQINNLTFSTDTDGGYTVAPQQFIARLIKKLDDLVLIRGLATKFQLTSAKSLGFPTLETNPNDADWTTEIQTVTEDTAMTFGKREFSPELLTKLIKVSLKLLRNSAIPIDTLIADRMAYKFAITHEKAFMTGDGTNKPLGVFTASASGIATNRDVATGNTATAVTFDGLKSAKWSLKAGYLQNANWIFHRDAVAMIDKIKNTDGDYIWQPSVQIGAPDRLLNVPVGISEYAPNTFTTGLYAGIIGDFSQYWIADSLEFSIQRLVELFAATNQVGFIGRMETDGAPVLSEAFARVKLG